MDQTSHQALNGRVALVTGASRGIGRAIAVALSGAGARLLLTARSEVALEEVASGLNRPEGDVSTLAGDITDEHFVAALFARVREVFGRLDILVNNAGVGRFGPIQRLSVADFRETLETNLLAPYMCMKQAVALMEEQGTGRILNVGSVRSRWTEMGEGGAYSASKYGLYALTESVARQFHGSEHNIKVSILCPGVTDTRLANPRDQSRPNFMRVEAVAAAALYALSAPDDVNVFDVTLFPSSQKPW